MFLHKKINKFFNYNFQILINMLLDIESLEKELL